MADVKSNIVDLEVVYKNLNTTIDKNIELLKEGASAVDAYNKKISVVPSDYKKGLDSLAVTLDNVKKTEIELTKAEKEKANALIKLNQLQRSQNQTEVSNIRTKTQLIALEEKHEKQLQREQQKLQASESLYSKVQAKLNALSAEYKDLAVRKEMGLSLTAKEEQRYASLQGRIQNYDKTLKAVDATMGKHQRNVGNYASGFNPLSNSINQLTREMPAFTYSVQTGFMALSNNIPIFTDAIGNAVKQNKELVAQGKPTTSVLSQLASAFFSWGTVLSVAITLTTVYGKELGELASKIFKSKSAFDSLKQSQKDLNDISIESKKNIASEVVSLKSLLSIAKDTGLSYRERIIAVKELQSTYPAYFGNLDKNKILAGEVTDAENALTEAILSRAKAQAATTKITENQSKIIDLEEERLSITNKRIAQEKILEYQLKQNNQQTTGTGFTDKRVTEASLLAQLKRKEIDITKEINKIQEVNNRLTSYAVENEKKSILLKEKDTKATEKNTKAKQEQKKVNADLYSRDWFTNTINALQKEQDLTASMSPKYELLQKQINLLKIAYESLYGTKKKFNEETQKELDGISLDLGGSEFLTDAEGDEIMEAGNKLRQTIKDLKSDFIDTFASESGFSGLLDIMAGGLDKFEGDALSTALVISEAFQEAFNTISEASQRNFDAEYARLEEQRDFAIDMAGGSATAREEIERQYDEKRRAIQRREAEAQKRLALFNILINTAQAVVSALPNIPLSIAIGVIGAVQAGIVASQEIPQFWRGTENAPEGLAWTQEKGAEVITDKSGNVKTLGSNKGAQLTYLSKGDKVYKSHEDYINKVLSKNGIDDLGSYINFAPQKEVNNSFDMVEMKQEFSKLASVIKNKEGVNISIDKKGFLTKKGNTEFINSRLNLTSRQV